MRTRCPKLCSICVPLLVLLISSSCAEALRGWPRQYDFDDGVSLTLYQPQVESWEDYRTLDARLAVSILLPAGPDPVLGAVRVSADTEVDFNDRLVVLRRLRITQSLFPQIDEGRSAAMELVVRRVFSEAPFTVELDRLLSNLERQESKSTDSARAAVRAPRLLVSQSDSVLVPIDGDPLYEPVGASGLEAVINTPFDLLRSAEDGVHYLRVGQRWLSASELDGAWTAMSGLPEAFGKIPDDSVWGGLRQRALTGSTTADPPAPAVFLTREPAELVVIEGQPEFVPVPETELLFLNNTESDVFLNGIGGDFYVLIGGRWFSAPALTEPLSFASDRLPADFARIPEDHVAGRVLASVPGTAHAKEAVLAAQIPRTARVSRSDASVTVDYEGEPVFQAIPATAVAYAVNTSMDIFRVGERYYVCHQAVWFEGQTPQGPWAVAASVPKEIYAIPEKSPKHHVTYVKVYESTPDHVVTGYESGYLGAFVVGGLLVYGLVSTDHAYVSGCFGACRPYYRHYYRSRPTHPVYRPIPYGFGHYYDHVTGSYRRGPRSDRYLKAGLGNPDPYAAWRGGSLMPTRVSAFNAENKPAKARWAPGAPDLYAGPDGGIYSRKDRKLSKVRQGEWRDGAASSGAVQRPPASGQSQAGLRPAVRARLEGGGRLQRYRNYGGSHSRGSRVGGGGLRR